MRDCVSMMDSGRIAPSAVGGVAQETASSAADDLPLAAAIHEQPRKKPGRPPGPLKAKVAPVDRERHEDSVQVEKPAATVAPVAPAIPTEREIQDALVAVNDKFGLDKAIECLSRFGVKRARELKENQVVDFVALCRSVIA